jgi:hypothetical protein
MTDSPAARLGKRAERPGLHHAAGAAVRKVGWLGAVGRGRVSLWTNSDAWHSGLFRGVRRPSGRAHVYFRVRPKSRRAVSTASKGTCEESTLLYVLSHTTPHTDLHINKSTEA